MKARTTALVVALLAGSLMFSAAGTAEACMPMTRGAVFRDMRDGNMRGGGMETITLRTFHIEATFPKTASIGETAKIKVNVTRPAKEDPMGNGVPMERPIVEPAEGVIVGIGLHIGNVFLPGAAITDAEGNTTIKIKIESYAPTTVVDVSAYAWKVAQQGPCFTIQEDGYRTYPREFKTTR